MDIRRKQLDAMTHAGLAACLTRDHVEAVRGMVVAGRTTREIAAHLGVSFVAMDQFLRIRRARWMAAKDEGCIELRDDRLILWQRRARPDGGFDLRPFSLARNSMHIEALKEAGRV